MKILITCLVFLIIGIFFINYNQIIADPKYIIAFLSFPAIIASAIVTYYVAFCPALTINLGKPNKGSNIDTPIFVENHHNAFGFARVKIEVKNGKEVYKEK